MEGKPEECEDKRKQWQGENSQLKSLGKIRTEKGLFDTSWVCW